MKKIIPILFCAVLSACSGFSDGDTGGKTDSGSVKLAEKIVFETYEDEKLVSSHTRYYSYDYNNRIKSMTEVDESLSNQHDYTYEANKVIESLLTYSIIYDFVDERLVKTTYKFKNNEHIDYFEYAGNLSKPETMKGVSSDLRYIWDSLGNLKTVHGTNQGFESSHYYTYSNVMNKCNIDFISWLQSSRIDTMCNFLDRNIFKCVVSPNLPSAETDNLGNIKTKFAYEFDEDGYVTEMKIKYLDNSDYYVLKISYRAANQQ